jgi:hypothetical protein
LALGQLRVDEARHVRPSIEHHGLHQRQRDRGEFEARGQQYVHRHGGFDLPVVVSQRDLFTARDCRAIPSPGQRLG